MPDGSPLFADLSPLPDGGALGAEGAGAGRLVGSVAGEASGLSFAELDRISEIEALAGPEDANAGDETGPPAETAN